MHCKYLEKQVQEWLKMGIVQLSTSSYKSPMFLVLKKDGGVKVVQDFRALEVSWCQQQEQFNEVKQSENYLKCSLKVL